MPVVEQGHDHTEAEFRQPSSELIARSHAFRQAYDLLRRLLAVRDRNYISHRVALGRHQQQTLTVNRHHLAPRIRIRQDGPANGKNIVAVTPANQRRLTRRGDILQCVELRARITNAEHVRQPLTVRLDRFVISIGRRDIALPKERAPLDRFFKLAKQKLVNAGYQMRRYVPLELEWPRPRKRVRASGEYRHIGKRRRRHGR